MISELAGYTLTRSLPDSVLAGVLSGSYKIFGGVVRNDAGQIIAHLVNAGNPVNMLSNVLPPVNLAFSGLNTYQLYRVGADVQKLIGLAQVGMVVSGLTLAVSSAGFLFLNSKINKVDDKLKEMAAGIEYIKRFLDMKERGTLITALKVLKDLRQVPDPATKMQMLVNSRQTLGEIHEKYKALLSENGGIDELVANEEYFTITAMGHALCSAELGMYGQATDDLLEFQLTWKKVARAFVKEKVIGKEPQRFLTRKYASHLKSEEIAGWMDFAEDREVGIDRLDQLRNMLPRLSLEFSKAKGTGVSVDFLKAIKKEEAMAINVARKIVQRDRVLQGYVDQYRYYSSLKMKPSEVQHYFDSLSEENKIDDCYVFLSNNTISA